MSSSDNLNWPHLQYLKEPLGHYFVIWENKQLWSQVATVVSPETGYMQAICLGQSWLWLWWHRSRRLTTGDTVVMDHTCLVPSNPCICLHSLKFLFCEEINPNWTHSYNKTLQLLCMCKVWNSKVLPFSSLLEGDRKYLVSIHRNVIQVMIWVFIMSMSFNKLKSCRCWCIRRT